LHIGSTVPVFAQSICHKNLMAFYQDFLDRGDRLNPATFRIPQVATRPADALNRKSKNASVRSAPEVQKVQLKLIRIVARAETAEAQRDFGSNRAIAPSPCSSAHLAFCG
jgi:hypothetical protein